MSEPDELYTLRAQYWLGHYQMAIEEAKSIARRPMSPALKAEREEFLHRAYLALGQREKLTGGAPALDALALKAKFDASGGTDESLVDQIKTMLGGDAAPSVQLIAAQVLLAAGQTKEALQCVHQGTTMEHLAFALQIYLKLDRLDLAKKQLELLRRKDEEAVLSQLGSVYVNLATGSTGCADAVHSLNSLTEQYGPSALLLNLMACALMQQGSYEEAEGKLLECLRDHPETPIPDTLVNLICCLVHQNKSAQEYVSQMTKQYPGHVFCSGLERVTTAFDRETVKYKV